MLRPPYLEQSFTSDSDETTNDTVITINSPHSMEEASLPPTYSQSTSSHVSFISSTAALSPLDDPPPPYNGLDRWQAVNSSTPVPSIEMHSYRANLITLVKKNQTKVGIFGSLVVLTLLLAVVLLVFGVGWLQDDVSRRQDPLAGTTAKSFVVMGILLFMCTFWQVMLMMARAMLREFKQGKLFYWCLLTCHVSFVSWLASLVVFSIRFWSEFQENISNSTFSMGIGGFCFTMQYIITIVCVSDLLIDCLKYHRKYC